VTLVVDWFSGQKRVAEAFLACDRFYVFGAKNADWSIAGIVGPQMLGGPSKWVAHIEGLPGHRYICRIRCRKCGKVYRLNQRARRRDHEWHCGREVAK